MIHRILVLFLLLFNEVDAQPADSSAIVTIYITFDDGPTKSSRYLQAIAEPDSIPVTVFLVGQHAFANTENQELLAHYRSNPIYEIANHSFSHANGKYKLFYQHPVNVVKDMIDNEKSLELTHKIARLPGRNLWRMNGRRRQDLADAAPAGDSLAAKGYVIFGWDVEWCYDTSGQYDNTASQMLEQLNVIARYGHSFVKQHIVILCHDAMLLNADTRNQFRLFCAYIAADCRFRFAVLSSYPVNPDSGY